MDDSVFDVAAPFFLVAFVLLFSVGRGPDPFESVDSSSPSLLVLSVPSFLAAIAACI